MFSLIFEEIVLSPPPLVNPNEENLFCLENISILSQNCNSLNLSINHLDRDQGRSNLKLNAILKNGAKIICLQDTRISTHAKKLENFLSLNNFGTFNIYINSSLGERGVVTLINKNVSHKVYKIYKSSCQNVLMIDIAINNERILLVNVYGPTQQSNRHFYPSLRNKIEQIGIKKFCIVGDLNALTCNLPINSNCSLNNYETLNMATLPNPVHTNNLVSWLREDFCVDKFRILYPNTKMFSYVPFNNLATNRSRIDHILVSNEFSPLIADVQYLDRTSKTFDHKPILLKGNKKNFAKIKCIDTSLLNIDHLFDTVKFDVLYFLVENFLIPNKNLLIDQLNNISNLSKVLQSLQNFLKQSPNDRLIIEWTNNLQNQIKTLCNLFPDIPYFLNFEPLQDYDATLESLLNTIKNSTISFQTNYIKNLKNEKMMLSKELANLRNQNKFFSLRFKKIEDELLLIEHTENVRLVENSRYFNILNNEKPSKKFSDLLKNEKKTILYPISKIMMVV